MTLGVGGSDFETELARMSPLTAGVEPIATDELQARVARAQALMRASGVDALYLDTSTNLAYFTGIDLRLTERLHGALIPANGGPANGGPANGGIIYLCPAFEEPKTRECMRFGTEVRGWEEHEDPTALVVETVRAMGIETGTLAVDPHAPFFTVDGFRRAGNALALQSAGPIVAACRQVKSPAEIALMQRANDITLEVHRAAARALRPGVTTTEVSDFVRRAHARLGMPTSFGAVQFGEATAYPHGVPHPQTLADGDMVLVDIGGVLGGYRSDITRTYVFGEPNPRQREIWDLEHRAQAAGFAAAARPGALCEDVDAGARGIIEAAGFGPGYKVPGLPHRTGHGIGMDVHEDAFMVKGNKTPLAPGMCFSVEPTICIYGEFGIRLEDIACMTATGPALVHPARPLGGRPVRPGSLTPRRMCNLYSITRGQAAIREAFRAVHDRAGNLPPFPGIFPDTVAPIIRQGPDGRELAKARWGFPSPPAIPGNRPVTNIRNVASSYWRAWLEPRQRCLVPATSFCEYTQGRPAVPTWFALDPGRPLFAFAGLWRPWTGTRGTRAEPADGEHTLFAFLTLRPQRRRRPHPPQGHAGDPHHPRRVRDLAHRPRSRSPGPATPAPRLRPHDRRPRRKAGPTHRPASRRRPRFAALKGKWFGSGGRI